MKLPIPARTRHGRPAVDRSPEPPPAPWTRARIVRLLCLVIAGVLALAVSANAATGKRAFHTSTNAAIVLGDLVATKDSAYALTKDRTAIYRWADNQDRWIKIGGKANRIYAGEDSVYATDPDTGDIHRYDFDTGSWPRIGGPGADFAATNKHLYGISPDHSAVYEYTGKGDTWTKVGGPADRLYTYTGKTLATKVDPWLGHPTDSALYATQHGSGDIYRYDGRATAWTRLGGPGAEFAVTDNNLYRLATDHTSVMEYAGPGDKWKPVRTERTEHLYAANTLYATDRAGDILKYNGHPDKWNRIGNPGAAFATSGDHLYGITPDGSALNEYTGKNDVWTARGAPVTPASREERIAHLDQLTQPGQAATDAWYRELGAHRSHQPDRYEFNWDTNVCNSPAPDKIADYDFSLACIRHDFGYHNYKDLFGDNGFRFSLTGPSPKERVDQIFLQDLNNICDDPGFPRRHTAAEREACRRVANSYFSVVALSHG
ncbi:MULTISPECIES: phospholipase A2 [unclassified Kitasatospora]|uniref:phospholipase A2 n=1 Tax=unclassified Kitasatospora TaxID=2633591 RepID=UPI00340A2090